jgi:hypothetical protein
MRKELVVNYVSAPPGTGKTKAAIEYMRRHILAGLEGVNVGYLVYVAPTKDLLDQTSSGLELKLPVDSRNRIFKVYSRGKTSGQTLRFVNEILEGRKVNSLDSILFSIGSVLFLTQETFLKLRRHDKFKETTVIFDESRKWIHKTTVDMNKPGAESLFHALFDVIPLKSKASGIGILKPKRLSNARKKELVTTKSTIKEFTKLDDLHRHLAPADDSPVRMSVYVVRRGDTLIHVKLPAKPFVGFRRVFILSADFKTSQMYHLFKSQGCILRDRTVPFMNKYLKGGYGNALTAIYNRQRHLKILPLLSDENRMPSKYQLNSGVILPKKNLLKLKKKLEELNLSTSVLRDVVDHVRDPALLRGDLTLPQRELLEYMKGLNCELNILQWQVDKSSDLVRRWFRQTGKNKSILFINEDRTADYDDNLFVSISTGKAEGNNRYKKCSAVCFLAAINPEKDVSRVLRAVLKDYDPDEDYVVDKAVQCIGRGNIRLHEAKEDMLAIVSTRYLATKISERMNDSPTILSKETRRLGDYVMWSLNDARVAGTNRLDDKDKAELAKLRVYLHRAKKKEDKEKVQELERSIAKLVAKRDEITPE